MKVKQQQMIFKMDGKFDWKQKGQGYWYVDLPEPRNIRYEITNYTHTKTYSLELLRLTNHGSDLTIGKFATLEEAQTRAELREARYEVKKATMESK